MENVTIGQIVGIVGTLTVLASFFFGIYKFVKNIVIDKIEKNTKDIENLKREILNINQEIGSSKEERLILLRAQLACLKGLKEQGCNGPVTQAINDVENYLIKKSHV